MSYDTESKSRNADFKNCGEAANTTLGLKGRQTYEPLGPKGPINPKNLFPQPFYTTRGVSRPFFYLRRSRHRPLLPEPFFLYIPANSDVQ